MTGRSLATDCTDFWDKSKGAFFDSANRSSLRERLLFRDCKAIADAAQGHQVLRIAGIAFNLFPQAPYIDIDGSRGDEGSLFPDRIEKLITCEDAAPVRGKVFEQAKFADGSEDIASRDLHSH